MPSAPCSSPPASLEILERLIAFDTTSRNSNLALIDFAATRLEDLGATLRLTHDDDGRKANLFATLGPAERSGVVLSGHTDVVPADGTDWTSDPFRATRRGDRLYGRGAADMKGFLAASLALAPAFAARPLASPIHFAFSYDEEIGCIGVHRLIADLATLPVRPRLCIVGEPTEMRVIAAHKGKKSVRGHVHGKESHSALNHRGVNAVEIAADMVTFLRHLQQRVREQGPFEAGFDPPYTTIHTGTIAGGRSLNIVPATCDFEFEIRHLPGHDPNTLMAELRAHAQSLIPEMLAVDEAAGIYLDEHNTAPGLAARDGDEAVRLALALTGRNEVAKAAFTTEAGLFQKADIPAVVCGPGSIDQAHKADEYIELDQLIRCETFLLGLLERLAA